MTREEWYAHIVRDHIQAVTEYLYTLNHEIDMRVEDLK